MENKMNKFGLERLLAVLAVAFACVSMWGCGFEDGTHKEWSGRDLKKIVGFLDDSLVIVGDARRWHEVSDKDGDVVGMGAWGRQALYLYNYRVQEKGPRWVDSLDNGYYDNFGYFKGQLTDSVIWGNDGLVWSFWKVYDKPYKVTINEEYDDCSEAFTITSVKQWLDNRFIALGESSLKNIDGCQYAVLDTVGKKLIYKRLDKDLEWIKECNDVIFREKRLNCLTIKDDSEYAYLIVNEKIQDSLPLGHVYVMGNYTKNVHRSAAFLNRILDVGNDLWYINEKKELVNIGVHVMQDGSHPANPGISFKDDNAGEIKY